MDRKEWNLANPVSSNYTACQQGKDFVELYPAQPGSKHEPPIPKISDRTALTTEQALKEYRELAAAEVPQFGWCTGVENQINNRLEQLKTIVFNHILEG